jgi:hypothetical protein
MLKKKMDEETENKCHRHMASKCFNAAWDLIEKSDRNSEDDEMMIYTTMASRYHWGQVGESIHAQRGEWQISRVYVILERGEQALHHAKICLKLTKEHSFKDFDLAFAYECMARASAAAGNTSNFEKYYKHAEEAGNAIEEEGDREYFFKDLQAGNWFGMR